MKSKSINVHALSIVCLQLSDPQADLVLSCLEALLGLLASALVDLSSTHHIALSAADVWQAVYVVGLVLSRPQLAASASACICLMVHIPLSRLSLTYCLQEACSYVRTDSCAYMSVVHTGGDTSSALEPLCNAPGKTSFRSKRVCH